MTLYTVGNSQDATPDTLALAPGEPDPRNYPDPIVFSLDYGTWQRKQAQQAARDIHPESAGDLITRAMNAGYDAWADSASLGA